VAIRELTTRTLHRSLRNAHTSYQTGGTV
jgi:hypothetical protein